MRAPTEVRAGLLVLGASGIAAAAGGPYRWEVRLFRAANSLPKRWHAPVWAVMQLGALGAGPALAAVAWSADRDDLAERMLLGATASWASAKFVKRVVRRGRPLALVSGTRVLGREATGGGYLSGHTAVATSLAAAAAGSPAGPALAAGAATVAVARMYVGAHLPLDVVGGAGLGLVFDGLLRRYLRGRCGRWPSAWGIRPRPSS